ncbi:UDP-N-acetylmuramate dehydrogenase [Pseudoalteromonas obscura]|uniref:UDP-N-acetylenolpyruvoylglucosamine reductase n=1 Tax=Pseudoalteromonas obscura TaxID=3048491 RepID=A0ABT7ET88_9GAMM|nr:UDP-N-acetylmuramate dehydrogenase [Pseudoalteromonas sp. P94(2023)]MDK2598262.1 UDP-N-acetylmuramate dehydrogenase [Pseudoalteromonas sp. P94(2023)]
MHSLQSLHTFALPSRCRELVRIEVPEQLTHIDFDTPFFILGEGSNCIFLEDFHGTVVLVANRGIEVTETELHYTVKAGAGENWHQLVLKLLDMGIGGLENLALIPGTVGAAPVQNIGAYGVELADVFDSLTGYNIDTKAFETLDKVACQFGYRDSTFKGALQGRFVITQVVLKLPKQWRPVLNYGPLKDLVGQSVNAKDVAERVMQIRRSKLPDPNVCANAGSFFKNPVVSKETARKLCEQYADMPVYPVSELTVKLAAGWLIEQAGLKGHRIGGIRVYDKQALVLVNDQQGRGTELLNMIAYIQQAVSEKFAIALIPEVRLVAQQGEWVQGDNYG